MKGYLFGRVLARYHRLICSKRGCATKCKSCHENRNEDQAGFSELENFFHREEIALFNVDDVDAERGVNDAKNQKMRLIHSEWCFLKEKGNTVPQQLTSEHWKSLLKFSSSVTRANFLRKLYVQEQSKQSWARLQAIKRRLALEEKEQNPGKGSILERDGEKYVKYGLNYNSLFRRIEPSYMNKCDYYRLMMAHMYAPHLVVDCSYDSVMDERELSDCSKEIFRIWLKNKIQTNPFNVLFCNVNETGPLWEKIAKWKAHHDAVSFPLFHTDTSYLNLYKRKNLVYLTPYTNQNLPNYDPDSTYIIGALSNNSQRGALSLAKAKREGLRTAKFPISQFVKWDCGERSLTPSKAFAIMQELKEQRDWRTIFEQHLPARARKKQGN